MLEGERFTESEWWGLEGTSVGYPAQPPAQAGSPRAGCTAPRPGGAGISPEKENISRGGGRYSPWATPEDGIEKCPSPCCPRLLISPSSVTAPRQTSRAAAVGCGLSFAAGEPSVGSARRRERPQVRCCSIVLKVMVINTQILPQPG